MLRLVLCHDIMTYNILWQPYSGPRFLALNRGPWPSAYVIPFHKDVVHWFISHHLNSCFTHLPPDPDTNQCEHVEHVTTNLDQLTGSSIDQSFVELEIIFGHQTFSDHFLILSEQNLLLSVKLSKLIDDRLLTMNAMLNNHERVWQTNKKKWQTKTEGAKTLTCILVILFWALLCKHYSVAK